MEKKGVECRAIFIGRNAGDHPGVGTPADTHVRVRPRRDAANRRRGGQAPTLKALIFSLSVGEAGCACRGAARCSHKRGKLTGTQMSEFTRSLSCPLRAPCSQLDTNKRCGAPLSLARQPLHPLRHCPPLSLSSVFVPYPTHASQLTNCIWYSRFHCFSTHLALAATCRATLFFEYWVSRLEGENYCGGGEGADVGRHV